MKGMAPYIDSALASLQAGLPARLDVYNAEPGQQVQLDYPPDGSYFFGGKEKLQASELPALEVAVPQADLADFSIAQVDCSLTPSVVVVAWAQDPALDMPALYRQSLGYQRCVLEVLLVPHAFGPEIKVERVQLFNPRPNPETRQFEYLTMFTVMAFTLDDFDRPPQP